jgi:hypothetical protein
VAENSSLSPINPGFTLLILEIVTPIPRVVEESTETSSILYSFPEGTSKFSLDFSESLEKS